MKLAGDYVFDSAVQDVWDALFDPQVLAAVMPGCEKLELVDGSFLGELKVKVGPIQGNFSGKVDLSDKIEPKSYKMVVDGRGSQGFVKATASIQLAPEGSGTRLTYDSDAQVGGRIASVGQRLVETSAKAIVKQSLEGLEENIKIRAAAYRAAAVEAKPEEPATPSAPAPAPRTPEARTPEPAKPAAAAPTSAPADAPTSAAADAAARAEAAAARAEAAAGKAEAAAKAAALSAAKPVVQYKQADAGKMASAVAKEVGKTFAPVIISAVVALAVVIYFVFVR